jgi:archaellum component FlaD/FlaE
LLPSYSQTHRGDDDDDEEEEEEEKQESGEHDPTMDQDQTVAQIKPEPEEKEQSRKGKVKAPMNELPILGEDELRKFRKEELLADVVHLQGKPCCKTLEFLPTFVHRANRQG